MSSSDIEDPSGDDARGVHENWYTCQFCNLKIHERRHARHERTCAMRAVSSTPAAEEAAAAAEEEEQEEVEVEAEVEEEEEFESTQVAKEMRNVNKRHALNNANLQSW